MANFKTIQKVKFWKDKDCTIEFGDVCHDFRVYPNSKGVIVNSQGGVFGMAYKSGKNNINKVVSCVTGSNNPSNEYLYSFVCQGTVAYFKLNINLYLFDEIVDGSQYTDLIPVEKKPDYFERMRSVKESDAMDNRSPLDSGIHQSY